MPPPENATEWCWWADAQGQRRLVEFMIWFGKLPEPSIADALNEFCEEADLENWNFQFGERHPTSAG